ncbi:MAG TPA: hypothetical protein VLZ83_01835 [Edaphocola sp.]|nr:hypothetical protein [Edaphocola sp.]
MIIDSLTLNRGIDFSRGSNADVKKYKIFKEKKKIIKMEYEEINNGYREWNKKTKIYFKNDIPFFITEKTNGIVTFYSDAGEKSEPYQKNEEIYIYDWKHEKFKKLNNGQDA